MYDLAVGDLGLARREFETMELGEFWCRLAGHYRKRNSELSNLRLIVWSALAPHSSKKIKPEDVFAIEGERKQKAKEAPDGNGAERFERLKQLWQL